MRCDLCGGKLVRKKMVYTIEFNNQLYIIEHVPAKECLQCGDRLYTPETVEKIQNAVWQQQKPDKIVNAPVIDYMSIV